MYINTTEGRVCLSVFLAASNRKQLAIFKGKIGIRSLAREHRILNRLFFKKRKKKTDFKSGRKGGACAGPRTQMTMTILLARIVYSPITDTTIPLWMSPKLSWSLRDLFPIRSPEWKHQIGSA